MTHYNEIHGFIRLREVLKLIPVSKSTWYRGIQRGIYPKPVKLSKRVSAWKASEIAQFILESDDNIQRIRN